MKSCITTFKGHSDEITCLDISPDSMTVVSGSMDGSIRLWDLKALKPLRSMQVSSTGYPTCSLFNPRDLCMAVGSSDKIVRYWELTEYSLISATTIETTAPQQITFSQDGKHAYVAFQDCIKVYILDSDSGRAHLLDMIPKKGNLYRDTLALKVSEDHAFIVESEQGSHGNLSKALLSQIALSEINLDPKVKPNLQQIPMPSQQAGIDIRSPYQGFSGGQVIRRGPTQVDPKQSVLAQNGLSLMGQQIPISGTQEIHPRMQKEFKISAQKRPPTSQSTKSYYEQPSQDAPSNLKMEDFLTDGPQQMTDQENLKLMQEAMKDHPNVLLILKKRNEMLDGILKFWQRGDLVGTLDALHKIRDANVYADALACTLSDPISSLPAIDNLRADQAEMVLKRILEILKNSKFKSHLQAACSALENFSKIFLPKLITSLRSQDEAALITSPLKKQQTDLQARQKRITGIISLCEELLKSKGFLKLLKQQQKQHQFFLQLTDFLAPKEKTDMQCETLKADLQQFISDATSLL